MCFFHFDDSWHDQIVCPFVPQHSTRAKKKDVNKFICYISAEMVQIKKNLPGLGKTKKRQMINDLTSILLLVRGRGGGRSKSAASACVRERMKETWCATWITVGPANVINGRPTLD